MTEHDIVLQPTEKHRSANKFQRMQKGQQHPHAHLNLFAPNSPNLTKPLIPPPGRAEVHKLGHFGLCVTDFAKSLEFWTGYFNFKPSDLLHDEDGVDMTAFMHLDRGFELVDHHSFFMFAGPKGHVHHSSFEVFDFDTQVLGHDWLNKKGYENCWGVGRHILGSQIFDYWYVFLFFSSLFFSIFSSRPLATDQPPTTPTIPLSHL